MLRLHGLDGLGRAEEPASAAVHPFSQQPGRGLNAALVQRGFRAVPHLVVDDMQNDPMRRLASISAPVEQGHGRRGYGLEDLVAITLPVHGNVTSPVIVEQAKDGPKGRIVKISAVDQRC